jgi:CysZ protein
MAGFRFFLQGISWLKSHPLLLVALYVPLVLGAILVVGILGSYSANYDAWMEFILFEKPDSLFGAIGYWLAYVSAFVGIILVSLLCGFLLPSIIASPFYDYVSMKVESSVTGEKPVEVSFARSLLLMIEEVKKAVFILTISLIAIFIPVVNIIVPAWMISWEFYDYPLARRGLGFGDRLSQVKGDFWGVLGMSVWFMIPFIQFLLMPLAVAGGTMLAVKSLNNK